MVAEQRYMEAEAVYLEALALDPLSVRALTLYGDLLRSLGKLFHVVCSAILACLHDYKLHPISRDLAKKIIEETESKSKIEYVPYAEAYGDGFEDMERRVPNIDLINQLVGWAPKRDLSTMIADISEEMKKGY